MSACQQSPCTIELYMLNIQSNLLMRYQYVPTPGLVRARLEDFHVQLELLYPPDQGLHRHLHRAHHLYHPVDQRDVCHRAAGITLDLIDARTNNALIA
jgi:hypothetical protein